jgi:hypothetical protein
MRYRLRTLMILLATLPPIAAGGYWLARVARNTYGGYSDGYLWYPYPAEPKSGYHYEWTGNGFMMVPDKPPSQD